MVKVEVQDVAERWENCIATGLTGNRMVLHMGGKYTDKIWNYKNFNMVMELDVAGGFIYDGIQALNQMRCVEESAEIFSFFYHSSVGLERLQKIVLVLFENITNENYVAFEESLKTHDHSALNARICKLTGLKTTSRENALLNMLTDFYKTARYNRLNVDTKRNEVSMLANFICANLAEDKIQRHFVTNHILVNDSVRELLGRSIGLISKEYYKLVQKGSCINATFTDELRYNSKAEKVFLGKHRHNSLQDQKITEVTVLKELLIYLRNTKQGSGLLKFVEKIPPIDIDAALLNEYIHEICRGVIPQSLIDEVECFYEENGLSVERMELVNLIGDENVLFDYDYDYDDHDEEE